MDGWIKLHRKSLENPIICKDSDYFTVWIYILLNATHKDYDVEFNNKRITLHEGQLITGRKIISNLFSINESKIQRILKKLEIEQQIEQQTCSKNRLITVLNWHKYQISEQPNEQQVNNERHQMNTNKNIKNDNNKRNKEYSRFAPPTPEEIKSYCLERKNKVDADKFHDFYQSKNWMVGKNKMKDWKAAVRTWERNSNNSSNNTQKSNSNVTTKNNFANYTLQRQYTSDDFTKMEKMLLGGKNGKQ